MSTFRPDGVIETCIYAADLDAAERFYRDVLGLEFHARVAGRHVFFRSGAGMFLIFNPGETLVPGALPTHGTRGPGHAAFAIDAATLPAWKARLAQHGVAVELEYTWPSGGHSLYFRDPAGNSIELTTPKTWQ